MRTWSDFLSFRKLQILTLEHSWHSSQKACRTLYDQFDLRDDTPLVSSGLIDSLALVNVLLQLEDVTGMRILAGKVQPKVMDKVNLM